MATVQVRVNVDEHRLRFFIRSVVADRMQRAAGRVRDYAKAEITIGGRVDTGLMRNATVAEVVRVEGNQLTARVIVNVTYASVQHDGSGIYGPRGAPIVPRRARVLRFTPKGARAFVFRPEVAGVQGYPFLTNALEKLALADFLP